MTAPCAVRVGAGAAAQAVADMLVCGIADQLLALDHAAGPVSLTPGSPPGPGRPRLYVDANSGLAAPAQRPAVRCFAVRTTSHNRGPATAGNYRWEVRYALSIWAMVDADGDTPGLIEARDRLALAVRWALVEAPLVGDRTYRVDGGSIREWYFPPGPGEGGRVVCDARIDCEVSSIEAPSRPPAGSAASIEVVAVPMEEV